MIKAGDEFGWTTLDGTSHYGQIAAIDSSVVYVWCQHHDKECCTEATDDELSVDSEAAENERMFKALRWTAVVILAIAATVAAVLFTTCCGSPTAPTFVCPEGWTCVPTPPTTLPAPTVRCPTPVFTGQTIKVEATTAEEVNDALVATIREHPELLYPDGGVIGWPNDWESQVKVIDLVYKYFAAHLTSCVIRDNVDNFTVERLDLDWDSYHITFTGLVRFPYQGTLVTEKR